MLRCVSIGSRIDADDFLLNLFGATCGVLARARASCRLLLLGRLERVPVVAAIGATFLVIRALWAWSEYSVSSRRLTRSYFSSSSRRSSCCCFRRRVIDIPGAQRRLCASTLETQAAGPFGSAMLSAGLASRRLQQPPDQWGSSSSRRRRPTGASSTRARARVAESALPATAGLCRDRDTLPPAPALNCSRVFAQGRVATARQACQESCVSHDDAGLRRHPPTERRDVQRYNVCVVQVKNSGGTDEQAACAPPPAARCGGARQRGGSTAHRRPAESGALGRPSNPSSIVGANGCVAQDGKPRSSLAVSPRAASSSARSPRWVRSGVARC